MTRSVAASAGRRIIKGGRGSRTVHEREGRKASFAAWGGGGAALHPSGQRLRKRRESKAEPEQTTSFLLGPIHYMSLPSALPSRYSGTLPLGFSEEEDTPPSASILPPHPCPSTLALPPLWGATERKAAPPAPSPPFLATPPLYWASAPTLLKSDRGTFLRKERAEGLYFVLLLPLQRAHLAAFSAKQRPSLNLPLPLRNTRRVTSSHEPSPHANPRTGRPVAVLLVVVYSTRSRRIFLETCSP